MNQRLNLLARIPWRTHLSWPVLLFAFFGGFGLLVIGSTAGGLLNWVLTGAVPTGVSMPEMLGQWLPALPGILCIVYFWAPRGKLWKKLGIRPLRWADLGVSLLVCFAALGLEIFVTVPWEAILKVCRIPYVEEQPVMEMLRSASWLGVLGFLLVVSVVVPIGEEIMYRRFLFGLFRPWGIWPAILLTSFLFAVIHFYLYGLPALFVMGIAFQAVYLWRRNLASAMLTHGIMNVIATIGALLEIHGFLG